MSEPTRVLVVEDSEDQATLLRKYFERAGCHVTVVGDAEHAIAAYLGQAPDLAVIDLVLPGMTGRILAQHIAVDLPDCAIVISSVLDPADYPDADAFLPKPFTGAQIRQILADTVPSWSKP